MAAARRPADVLAASQAPTNWVQRSACAHLESNLAAALTMKSATEYRYWLATYAKQLAADEDEVGDW